MDRTQPRSATPARGCLLAEHLPLGDACAHVEYEYEPADGDGWNEPHYEASVTVLRVLINGVWCDVSDLLQPEIVERWEQHLLETIPKQRAEAEAEARIDAYVAAREAA